jgi:hypothetical protein
LAKVNEIRSQNAKESASASAAPHKADHEQILTAIERLGEMKKKGYISDVDFQSKKDELLRRL